MTPTVTNIGDRSQWEFYAGGHGSAARWVVGDVSKASPLLEFTNHTGCTTMTYFAAIKKFVITINTASNYPVMDGGDFDTWMLEIYLDIQNVYYAENAEFYTYSYDYAERSQVGGLPILPTLGLKAVF